MYSVPPEKVTLPLPEMSAPVLMLWIPPWKFRVALALLTLKGPVWVEVPAGLYRINDPALVRVKVPALLKAVRL